MDLVSAISENVKGFIATIIMLLIFIPLIIMNLKFKDEIWNTVSFKDEK